MLKINGRSYILSFFAVSAARDVSRKTSLALLLKPLRAAFGDDDNGNKSRVRAAMGYIADRMMQFIDSPAGESYKYLAMKGMELVSMVITILDIDSTIIAVSQPASRIR